MGSGAFLVEACRQLGKLLTESWRLHGGRPEIPSDQDEETFARRLVARRCLYGVDRNPIAVDLAKLSLWLATLSKDQPLTFVDHALRSGDSLLGLSNEQIARFHWISEAEPTQLRLESEVIRPRIEKVHTLRQKIHRAAADAAHDELHGWEHLARDEAAEVALYGDLALTAFFDAATAKAREARRKELATEVRDHAAGRRRGELAHRRSGDPPFAPFHWQVEFPEVFARDIPGFDAIVGNPPFAGKDTTASSNAARYPLWLRELHPGSHGNSDLVAHFFRRAFDLLRHGGAVGLVATNTIAQGDTRSTGLRRICRSGEIYHVQRRVPWPGAAAVFVSIVHCFKGHFPGTRYLDGRNVSGITAFLSHAGGHDDPPPLNANLGKSFQGNVLLGMGFTFDDTDKKRIASRVSDMYRLLRSNPKYHEVIFPYIGGAEMNTSPVHAYHRYVINFRDWPLRRDDLGEFWAQADDRRRAKLRRREVVPIDYPEPVAADYPEALSLVQERVKPQRDALPQHSSINRDATRRWWQFFAYRRGLNAALNSVERTLAIPGVTQYCVFTFLPANVVHSHGLTLFPLDTYAAFCVLQSSLHAVWARTFASTLADRLRYNPSDCFDTFPFPPAWATRPALEAAGREYYDMRAGLMVSRREGLTKTYNRFHDPDEADPAIQQLRHLHEAMDRVVLDAYGWTDIPTGRQFILDYEEDEQGRSSTRRKRPWRYRWPDDVRDEVLGRLLALNAERAAGEEEARCGAAGVP